MRGRSVRGWPPGVGVPCAAVPSVPGSGYREPLVWTMWADGRPPHGHDFAKGMSRGMTSATSTRRGRRAQQEPDGPDRGRTSTPAPAVASPRTLPTPGGMGPVRLQQLILVELAAAVMLVAWVTDVSWLLAPAGAVAALLLLLAVLRRGRRPLAEWYDTARALRRRQREAKLPVPPGTDALLAPVVECDPALRTHEFLSRDDRSIGLIGDGTFLTAVLFVQPHGPAVASRGRRAGAAAEADPGGAGGRRDPARLRPGGPAHPARARTASARAVDRRAVVRPPAGADRFARAPAHLGRSQAGPGAVPGGGSGARRRCSRGAARCCGWRTS